MPAGATYEPIATTTLASNGTITFSSIPNTYTDLRLIINGGIANNGWNIRWRYNNNSSAIYSYTYLYGETSTAVSGRVTGDTKFATTPGVGSGNNSLSIISMIDIFNYSNTNIYKNTLSRSGEAPYMTHGVVGLWSSTAAINEIFIFCGASDDGVALLYAGTTATLYGIKAA